MAKLSQKIRSHVETISDWPRGTRKRGIGFLHDRVWFPTDKSDYELLDPEKTFKLFDNKWHELYLDRRMFWFKFGIRIHTFHIGDDDAAVHDHPWWFITFPLRSYTETYEERIPAPFPWYDWRRRRPAKHPMYWVRRLRVVRAFRFHFRSAKHRHFVHEPFRPFRTIIFTGRLKNNWGFWPESDTFIPHREWSTYNREVEEVQ